MNPAEHKEALMMLRANIQSDLRRRKVALEEILEAIVKLQSALDAMDDSHQSAIDSGQAMIDFMKAEAKFNFDYFNATMPPGVDLSDIQNEMHAASQPSKPKRKPRK